VSPAQRDTAPRVAAIEPRPDTAARAPVSVPPSTPRRREPPSVRAPAQPAPAVERQDTLVRMLRDRALAAMSRALEAGATPRDLAEIRRVYPGLTSAEQGTFSQFFESVSDLKAGLTINRLIIAGGSADAFVSGVYEYRDSKTGRSRRDTTSFRATLLQDSTGWHLTAIRSVR